MPAVSRRTFAVLLIRLIREMLALRASSNYTFVQLCHSICLKRGAGRDKANANKIELSAFKALLR